MTGDDIIRKFLDLHPDTPIDGQEYAIPLRTISRMLEVAAAVEREAWAKEWVGLTDEEIKACAKGGRSIGISFHDAIRKAEAKLKEKNSD